jgi:hypothetical protein
VGEGVDGSQDKGVDKGHGLLVTAWGQAEKNAWGEHKGEDGKEEKHHKVHLVSTNIIFEQNLLRLMVND